MRACLVPAPSGCHGLSLGPWHPRPWQRHRGGAPSTALLRASEGRLKVSSLGYGLGSWGLLNVTFVLSMLYSGRGRRPYEQPRAACQSVDQEVRLLRGSRADRRRPRADCGWPARSAYVQAWGSGSRGRRRDCRRAWAGRLLHSFDDSYSRRTYRSGWRRVMKCRV